MGLAAPADLSGMSSTAMIEEAVEGRRLHPVRGRAAAAFAAILSAAAGLLVEKGLPGFNTNAVAKAAKVNIATLYQFFPNKIALLRELYERSETADIIWSRNWLEGLADTADLPQWLEQLRAHLCDRRPEDDFRGELRRAYRAIPELVALEDARAWDSADALAAALVRRAPNLAAGRAILAARLLVRLTAAIREMRDDSRYDCDQLVDKIERLVGAYLVALGRP
jgi:AcrR family transcriptional regulator